MAWRAHFLSMHAPQNLLVDENMPIHFITAYPLAKYSHMREQGKNTMRLRILSLFTVGTMLSAPLAAQDASGNAADGETLFNRQCIACHVIESASGETLAGRNASTGPNLYGVIGAAAGAQADFRYSDSHAAYGKTGVIWEEENTVAFLQNPDSFLRDALGDPRARSKMAHRVRAESDARDIYAFLARFSANGTEEAAAATSDDTPDQTAAIDMLEPDLAAGEAHYQASCRNCHGPKARGMASFPKLSGKDMAYLVTRLEHYRAGEMVGPNSALMFPIAADMSDQDIANVAAYITANF
jgi:cytochrome c